MFASKLFEESREIELNLGMLQYNEVMRHLQYYTKRGREEHLVARAAFFRRPSIQNIVQFSKFQSGTSKRKSFHMNGHLRALRSE